MNQIAPVDTLPSQISSASNPTTPRTPFEARFACLSRLAPGAPELLLRIFANMLCDPRVGHETLRALAQATNMARVSLRPGALDEDAARGVQLAMLALNDFASSRRLAGGAP